MENAVVTTENAPEILAEKDARIAELEQQKVELEALVKYYEEQLRLAKHRQFGSSSEKGEVPEQLGLFDEAENTADPKNAEPELEEINYQRKKRVGKREEDWSALPVEVIEYDLSQSEQTCPDCGGKLYSAGQEVRRELTIIPAEVMMVEHRKAVYGCRHCENHSDHVPVIKAPAPEPLIQGSLASASLVAHIMDQKYVMSVPLYRQEQAFLRDGIPLSRQTMANWVIRCAEDYFALLYGRMKTLLLLHDVLHADETVCQVLHEPGKKANTNSYMWLYSTSGCADHPIILYEYQPTRSSTHPKRFLDGWESYLHADGYRGYHNLPPGITVVGCWVHLRRKLTDGYKSLTPEEKEKSVLPEGIAKIGTLFHLETQWKDLAPEERQKLRLEQSKPLAEAFFAWADSLGALPQSPPGKMAAYAREQRQWLMNFYLDGRLELSNNRAENAIRPCVVGRKNWLFNNTQRGARASSIIYSIVETAKANGLKPFRYLEFLLKSMPDATTGSIDSLLPWGDAVPESCRMTFNQ
jgi:transposase